MDRDESVTAAAESSTSARQVKGVDRRVPSDRRGAHDLNYFTAGGGEQRAWRERRQQLVEARKGWQRVSDWTSAVVGISFGKNPAQGVFSLE
ncbi:MAG: hypothetical protein Q8P24_13960 [Desulfobacterales bacterium]|nr:hypothetical protein [Desulfobacterales bacterium]